jgi:hypothetical protein
VNFSDVIARLRTAPPEDASRAITYTAGEVALNLFNARGQAGSYPGMQPVGHAPQRPDYGPARNSATPPNGTHGLADPQSHAVANKGLSDLEIMKRTQRPMYGGNR